MERKPGIKARGVGGEGHSSGRWKWEREDEVRKEEKETFVWGAESSVVGGRHALYFVPLVCSDLVFLPDAVWPHVRKTHKQSHSRTQTHTVKASSNLPVQREQSLASTRGNKQHAAFMEWAPWWLRPISLYNQWRRQREHCYSSLEEMYRLHTPPNSAIEKTKMNVNCQGFDASGKSKLNNSINPFKIIFFSQRYNSASQQRDSRSDTATQYASELTWDPILSQVFRRPFFILSI